MSNPLQNSAASGAQRHSIEPSRILGRAHRAHPLRGHVLAVALATCLLASCGVFQQQGSLPERNLPVPAEARLGLLQSTDTGEVLIDGRPVDLPSATRIITKNNRTVTPSRMQGLQYVAYTLGTANRIDRIWLLDRNEFVQMRAFKRAQGQ